MLYFKDTCIPLFWKGGDDEMKWGFLARGRWIASMSDGELGSEMTFFFLKPK